MWNRVRRSIGLFTILLCLSACMEIPETREAETAASTREKTDTEKAVIRWWYEPAWLEDRAFWDGIADQYMAAHPDVTIEITVPEDEPLRSRLAAAIQAGKIPDIFPGWGGYEMNEYINAGLLKEITPELDADGGAWRDTFAPGALAAYAHRGKTYGVPWGMGMVGFWYNTDLFNKAGIAAPPATWVELLEDVRKLREAGILPIALGDAELWPGGFYWTYLALRIGGPNAFDAAASRTGSFADPPFVEAGLKLRELIALSPFPEGFLDLNYPGQSALMGDGAAAMELMGEWAPGAAANARADPQGVGAAFGFFPFPVVEGGAGSAADALGGVNGFVVGRDAPPEAADFLKFLTSKTFQIELAKTGLGIPVVKGAEEGLSDPLLLLAYRHASAADHLLLYIDRYLPQATAAVIQDAVRGLLAGTLTPEEAARQIENSASAEII